MLTVGGQITFEDLAEGSYTLTETSNPDQDCETGGTLTVMVSAEGDITVTDDDEADGLAIVSFDSETNILVLSNDCEEDGGEEGEDLVLIKEDLDENALDGVGFTLGDGDEMLTVGGQITFEDLAEGSYTLTETSNPDQDCETGGTLTVMVSAEGDITVTDDDEADGLAIVSFDSETNILVLSNDCEEDGGEDDGLLEIDKFYCPADEDGTEFIVTDPAQIEDLRVQGAEEEQEGCEQGDATFTIEKSTGEIWEDVMLGDDGQIELPLPDGEYTITETSTDEDPAPSASFTIENGAITAVIVINSIGEDEDEGQLKIIKLFCEADTDSVTFTIEGGEQQPPSLENCELGNAAFQLNDGDTFTIGADGILFANVEVGDYTLDRDRSEPGNQPLLRNP